MKAGDENELPGSSANGYHPAEIRPYQWLMKTDCFPLVRPKIKSLFSVGGGGYVWSGGRFTSH